jgi:predicted DNA-binding transcriptional regulator YafY
MFVDNESTFFEWNILISEEFIRNLLGFAGEINVLAPDSLRKEMRERAEAMFMNYR